MVSLAKPFTMSSISGVAFFFCWHYTLCCNILLHCVFNFRFSARRRPTLYQLCNRWQLHTTVLCHCRIRSTHSVISSQLFLRLFPVRTTTRPLRKLINMDHHGRIFLNRARKPLPISSCLSFSDAHSFYAEIDTFGEKQPFPSYIHCGQGIALAPFTFDARTPCRNEYFF